MSGEIATANDGVVKVLDKDPVHQLLSGQADQDGGHVGDGSGDVCDPLGIDDGGVLQTEVDMETDQNDENEHLDIDKGMENLSLSSKNGLVDNIVDGVVNESYWRARSVEVWGELKEEPMEIQKRVGDMICNEVASFKDEAKKIMELELKKKRQLAKQKKAKCTWMKKSLAKGLVHEIVEKVIDLTEFQEDRELIDHVLQEEVMEGMKMLWLVDDMVLDDSPQEMKENCMDIDMCDQLLRNEAIYDDNSMEIVDELACDHGVKSVEGRIPIGKSSFTGKIGGFGKYFEKQLVVINLVGASSTLATRKRTRSSKAGHWLSWVGMATPSRGSWRRARRMNPNREGKVHGVAGAGQDGHVQGGPQQGEALHDREHGGDFVPDNTILQVHGLAGADHDGHVQGGPQQEVHQDQGTAVATRNALTTLMENSAVANWSSLVRRRSMKEKPKLELKPASTSGFIRSVP